MMPTNTSNAHFQSELRKAYASISGKRRSIQLPDPDQFQLSGDKKTLRLYLTGDALTRNMQENVAAFEGWILALKAWECADTVVLDWREPSEGKADGHYQRFLYRVNRFRELFPDWFSVEREKLLQDSKVTGAETLFLNAATSNPKTSPAESSQEARLEMDLVTTGWLTNEFGLDKIGRQFPVGLFSDSVAKSKMIFTGGKSAIDLIGIDKNGALWVFELKAKGNQPLGIVSELLFYTAMMRDLAQGKFKYDDKSPVIDGRLRPGDVVGIKKICGCLLAPSFHPLLDGNRIVNLLNEFSSSRADMVTYFQVPLSNLGNGAQSTASLFQEA
ncbi:MAG: hypothetical protein NTV11_10005 [Rhodocyclales bacterium]|nr:hypothetical protein [Rhodocyclales bacterium]